jgi:hypothetical protein
MSLCGAGRSRVARTILLWEVGTGRQLARLEGHRGPVHLLAFAPDGRRLASASQDGTALIWDVTRARRFGASHRRETPARWAAREREALWADLGSEDAVRADRALRRLEKTPAEAVRLLAGRLRPAEPVPPGRLARLVADLDSASAEVRGSATRQLEALEDQAEAELRRAADRLLSPEGHRRVARLLDRLERTPSVEGLRQLRAV